LDLVLDPMAPISVTVVHGVPGVAEVAMDAEDDTVVATTMMMKKLAAQVPRVNTLRKKVRPEKQRKTLRDVPRVAVAEEAFMVEVGMAEVCTAEEVGGPMPIAIAAIMDAEDLADHQEAWVHLT